MNSTDSDDESDDVHDVIERHLLAQDTQGLISILTQMETEDRHEDPLGLALAMAVEKHCAFAIDDLLNAGAGVCNTTDATACSPALDRIIEHYSPDDPLAMALFVKLFEAGMRYRAELKDWFEMKDYSDDNDTCPFLSYARRQLRS